MTAAGDVRGRDPAPALALGNQIGEWPRLEAMGFESIWLNDHLHSLGENIDAEAFDASTTLAAMALSTQRVRIGRVDLFGDAPDTDRALQADRDHRPDERRPGCAWNRRRLA